MIEVIFKIKLKYIEYFRNMELITGLNYNITINPSTVDDVITDTLKWENLWDSLILTVFNVK